MSITVSCESCGVTYRVDDAAAGKTGRCKQCGGSIRVPTAPQPSTSGVGAPPPLPVRTPSVAPPPQIVPIAAEPIAGYPPAGPAGYGPGAPISPAASGTNWKLIGGIIAGVVVLVGVAIWLVVSAVTAVRTAANNVVNQATAAAGSVNMISPAMFPPRPVFRTLQPGVQFAEVRAGFGKNSGMKLWIYLPGDAGTKHDRASLPCVFMAPAGSNLMMGMDVMRDDRPEHLPYVKAGFAVVAFALDGWVADRNALTDAEAEAAIRLFMASDGGMDNAKTAIDYATAKLPEIDPSRIYTAGHSSAGTVSLLMASHDSRLCGALAFAPCVDIEKFQDPKVVEGLDDEVPGLKAFLRRTSPVNAPPPMCPVFLFHADDDAVLPIAEARRYAGMHSQVTLSTVPTGGHENSTMDVGIDRGIEWLKQTGAKPWSRQTDPETPEASKKTVDRPAKSPPAGSSRQSRSNPSDPKPPEGLPLAELGELQPDPDVLPTLLKTARIGMVSIWVPDKPGVVARNVSLVGGRAMLPIYVAEAQLMVVVTVEPRTERDADKPAISTTRTPASGRQTVWEPRATSAGYGTINGKTFARTETPLGSVRTQVLYAAFIDNHFVKIQLQFPVDKPESRTLAESIARTIH